MNSLSIIEQLKTTHTATREQLIFLLKNITGAEREELRQAAQQTAQAVFGNKIYIRGLVEISSICKRDCRYCGLRRSNPNAVRYRLAPEQILSCCEKGYALGFRTFVLQGGEDGFFSDEVVCGAPSPCRSVSAETRAFAGSAKPAQTGICCGTRPPTWRIMPSCTPTA